MNQEMVTEIALHFDLRYLFRYPLKPLKIKNLNDSVTNVTENYYPLYKKEEDENIYKELTFCVTSLHPLPQHAPVSR